MNRAIDTKSGLRDDVEVLDQPSKNFEKKFQTWERKA